MLGECNMSDFSLKYKRFEKQARNARKERNMSMVETVKKQINEKADKLEQWKSNFLLYPPGPEGTTVSRKQWEKEVK